MQKILVATDGSDGAQVGVTWAAELIATSGAKAVLATVMEPSGESADTTGEVRSLLADQLEHEWALPLDELDLNRELLLLEGDPRTALVAAATGGDIDAVVVGTRGAGGFHGLGVGSTTHYLARRLPCPLVVVPAIGGPLASGTLVAGADGSAANERALRWTAEVAGSLGARATAVYAYSPLSDVMTHRIENWQYPWEAKLRAEISRAGTEATEFEIVLAAGHPVEELVRVATERDAGLIVVGRRGLGSVHGLFLGRIPAQLLHHSSRPLAIVPH